MSTTDNYLAEAEDWLRGADYSLPIAWALGMIVDFRDELVEAVKDSLPDLAENISECAAEIEAAFPREDGNEDEPE